MRRRRASIATITAALAMLGASLVVDAQQSAKTYRIGVLETTSAALSAPNLEAFKHGLQELGYIEGRNLFLEYRFAEGRAERFPEFATELVRLRVDLMATRGTPAALAAQKASGAIPVVMLAIGEPLGVGVVASLARPGGNVTGLSAFVGELQAKRLEVLREIVSRVARIAAVFNMGNPSEPPQWKAVAAAALRLGARAQLLDVRKAEDLAPALEAAAKQRVDALVVGMDGVTQANRRAIVELAAKHRLPAVYGSKEFVDDGGLISYGVSYPHLYRRAATLVDKIFKGAKPGDLPVEQPTTFELVINLKTSTALGLSIPPSMLHRADRVIQ
ncbi:MAG: ABC transporter substrate-binding protein [Candidatus Rokuibacteriota bacterium]